jgi:hypothetical protein
LLISRNANYQTLIYDRILTSREGSGADFRLISDTHFDLFVRTHRNHATSDEAFGDTWL